MRCDISTGLWIKAQGCEARATMGSRRLRGESTPKVLRIWARRWTNPKRIVRPIRQRASSRSHETRLGMFYGDGAVPGLGCTREQLQAWKRLPRMHHIRIAKKTSHTVHLFL